MATKHLIKHWKGQRKSFNFLRSNSALDAWTIYTVVETDGSLTEYFGDNRITAATGQLLPVKSIVESVDGLTLLPGDRYLVGTDATGYKIYEYTGNKDGTLSLETLDFDYNYGIRVRDRGLKNFIYADNTLKTYDDVDCGEF